MRPRVYISCPLTLGNRTMNVATANNYMLELMRKQFAVFNPALSMCHLDGHTISHEEWLENYYPWIKAADVVQRLPGESVGADAETKFAEMTGIPVVHSYDALLRWRVTWEAAHRSVANGT